MDKKFPEARAVKPTCMCMMVRTTQLLLRVVLLSFELQVSLQVFRQAARIPGSGVKLCNCSRPDFAGCVKNESQEHGDINLLQQAIVPATVLQVFNDIRLHFVLSHCTWSMP
jgi:hypothetical protein